MKTTKMLPIFSKSTNLIVILMMILSQFSWGATRALADDPKVYSDMVVRLIQTNFNEGGWRAANTASFIKTADDLGISLQVHDGQGSQANQIAAFQSFIDDPSVNVIVLAAVQPDGWDTILQAAQTAGKVVVLEDRPIDSVDSLYSTYVGPDLVEEGRKAGTAMCDLLNGSPSKNVVELAGDPGASAAQDRALGFREITDTCGITITQSQTAYWNRNDGQQVMATWLGSSTDIQGVFAQNDQMGFGAIQAIKDASLDPGDDIKIVSVDAEAEAFRAMIAGDLNVTVECNPLLAPQVYAAALRALNADPTLPKFIPAQEGVFYRADAATIYPTRYDYSPNFAARFPENQVHGYGWYPLGASITINIDDPDNGVGVDHTDTQTVVVADWNPNETWVGFDLGAFTLEPGQLVSMTDGTTTKTHTVTSLTVTNIDPDADTVAGTAAPGSQVDVGHICDQNGCAFRRVITNGSGDWLADFSAVGEDGDEQDLFDIRPGIGNEARQPDEDGDSTTVQWRLINPYIQIVVNQQQVHCSDWPMGATLTLTIDDPSNGVNVDYSDTKVVGEIIPPDESFAMFDLNGHFEVEPGDIVTVTDGTTTKQHTVHLLDITLLDQLTDQISGIANVGDDVNVYIWNTQQNRMIQANASGNWTADFSQPSGNSYDLHFGDSGSALIEDADRDGTEYFWRILNPYIEASPANNWAHARDWPNGTPVTLTIDDPSNGVGIDKTANGTMGPAPWNPSDPNDIVADFDLEGFDLQPGHLLVVTDGATERSYTPTNLAVTGFDVGANTISGTTNVDGEIHVWINGGPDRQVLATGGFWGANFSPDDLAPGMDGGAQQSDANGNRTHADWHVPNPHIETDIDENWARAREWPNGTLLTLTIDDPSNGVGIDKTANAIMGPAPWNPGDPNDIVADFDLGGFDLQSGQLVKITDGTTERAYTIPSIVVTAFDLDADTISGTATPNAQVEVCAGSCTWRFVTADGSGNWTANFSGLVDLKQGIGCDGCGGVIWERDANDNTTQISWAVPITRAFYLKANAASDWVHAYGWQAGDPLTLVVDRPGVGSDVDYTTTVNAGAAPWNASSPVADIVGVFDLDSNYDLQPGDELTVSSAGHTETYTVPVSMTQVRWFIGLGNGSEPTQIPVEQQVVDDFNISHPTIELIIEVTPADQARNTLSNQITAGNAPDLVGPTGWSASNAFHGQWLDLDPLITSSGFNTGIFDSEMLQAYQTDAGQEGLPFMLYPASIFYQKSMFDAAGLNYPPANYGDLYEMPDHSMVAWNFDTLKQVALLLTLDNTGKNATEPGFDKNSIVQYGYIPQWQTPTAMGSFWDADTPYSGTPGNYTALIPSPWDAAWRWYYDGMWSNQPFIPNNPAINDQMSGNAFNSGKVAMAQVEAWYTCCINEAGSNWDLAALPAYNGTVHNVVHADTFRILQDTANPNETFTVLAYLLTDGVQKLILGAPDQTPAYNLAMPGRIADQAAYFASRSAQFPWAANWQVLQAGLNYPDIPNSEAWMPNYDQALERLTSFGNQMADRDSLNIDNELACLQNDLQHIFNNQPTQGCASFSARFPENEVHGYSWPLGASVTLTIDDPDNGVGVDHTDTQTAIVAPWDPNQTWAQFVLGSFTLEPGQLVSMTGGATTKTHTVTDLTVTTIDPVADTIAGTAQPGSQVDVGHICDQNGCAFRRVITNGSGIWLADFSVVGEDDDEKDLFNIRPGTSSEARQPDVDGDTTTAQWGLPSPYIQTNPGKNWVEAREWPNGATVTLTIDDPSNGEGVDKTVTAIMAPDPGKPSMMIANFVLNDFVLLPGQLLTVTDGITERTHTPTNLAITSFDLATDTISGIAMPNVEVEVCVNIPGDCARRYVTPDGTGNWTVDYAHPGIRGDEQQLVDLQPGDRGAATQGDGNGNQTKADWGIPNPGFNVRANSDQVGAHEWPLGNTVTLEIDDPGTPLLNPDYTDTETIVVDPKDPNGTYAEFNLQSLFDIQPGFVVNMNDGITTKTHTVTVLEFTSIDLGSDLVYGIADPNVRVNVWACDASYCYNRHAMSNGSGNWTVDFSEPGTEDNEQVIFDLIDGTWIDSNQEGDPDGDSTMFGMTVSLPTISNIVNQSTNEDTATGAIPFTIGDPETPISSLVVTAVSSNHALVPNGNITLGGSGADRTITLTPAANQSGASTITITVDDGVTTTSDSFVLTVNPINDPPVITSNGGGATANASVAENSTAVATVSATDVDAGATQTYAISGGADAAKFTINTSSGALAFASAPNFESPTDVGANNVYDVTVQVSDGLLTDSQTIAVTVTNVNEAPSLALVNTTTSLAENVNTSAAIKVADITITDDALGVNTLSLSGADAALFEIAGSQLRIKAGAALDFETNPVLNVNVAVDDTSVGATPDDSETLAITLTDVDEIRPVVVSSLRANTDPTAAAQVSFTVTFSEVVTGVENADFSLNTSGVTGATVSSVSGSGATYTVTVNTGNGNGAIRLDVPASASITDMAGNALTGLPYTSGQSYTINKTLTINSIGAQDGWILETSETSGKGGVINSSATAFNLGDDATRKQYLGILSFGTGAVLPDNAVITGITLKVKRQAVVGGGNPVTTFQGFMVDIKNGFFGAPILQAADFQTLANKTYGPFNTALVGGWYSINLISGKAYINKLATNSGLTQIRLRFKLDDNNNTLANYLGLYSGNAPVASRPQLIIQYYVP